MAKSVLTTKEKNKKNLIIRIINSLKVFEIKILLQLRYFNGRIKYDPYLASLDLILH